MDKGLSILLTGASGFIGRGVAQTLCDQAHRLILLARKEDTISNRLRNKAALLKADLANPGALSDLDCGRKLDVIIHLAACLDYYGDKEKLRVINVEATKQLLDMALRHGAKKFIFASSIEAMGPVTKRDIPACEEYPCLPVSNYGRSKLAAERLVLGYTQGAKISGISLRLGNVYGPGNPAFLLPMSEAVSKKGKFLDCLSFYKDRYLHPVYIDDVAEEIVALAGNDCKEGSFIVSGPDYITIEELLILVAQQTEAKVEFKSTVTFKQKAYCFLRKASRGFLKRADFIDYVAAGKGERVHRAYSIQKAKKELGYCPRVTIAEGMRETLKSLGDGYQS